MAQDAESHMYHASEQAAILQEQLAQEREERMQVRSFPLPSLMPLACSLACS